MAEKTFAQMAKSIENKYYKNRKPGEDSMTDESFNREMSALMEQQEAVKAQQPSTHTMPDGTVHPGATHEEYMAGSFAKGGSINIDPSKRGTFKAQASRMGIGVQEAATKILNAPEGRYSPAMRKKANFAKNFAKAYGGALPKYKFGGPYYPSYAPGIFGQGIETLSPSSYGGSGEGILGSLQASGGVQQDLGSEIPGGLSSFSPVANIAGPIISIGSEMIANRILKGRAEEHAQNLKDLAGVNLGRVDPVQISLRRARADVRGQQALTTAQGRYAARNVRSAAERANLQNQARISSQRIAGEQLSRLGESEEIQNAQFRARARDTNRQLRAQEAMLKQQQLMDIEKQYGGIGAQLDASLSRNIGSSIGNYLAENQMMQRDLAYLNMSQPNYQLDYNTPYDELGFWGKLGARTGTRYVAPQIVVR